ncbi:hypothetical protein FMEAI12_1730006 [Parafrankia sp. Ea1.12]|nr:hypothetical protein FMEAI12_1730006 [Parafrankia sp. Ea1.12]
MRFMTYRLRPGVLDRGWSGPRWLVRAPSGQPSFRHANRPLSEALRLLTRPEVEPDKVVRTIAFVAALADLGI